MIVLTIALFRLYHKMFRVIYTNALSGIARELFICFLLAGAIVVGIPLAIQSVFLPKKPVPDYYGNFYNTAFLEGQPFQTSIAIGESESSSDNITISGYAYAVSVNYQQNFVVDIPRPEENSFTFCDQSHESTLTINFHPKNHTLEINQEAANSGTPTPYTGKYVDNDTWDGLLEERRAAKQAIEAAMEPNHWIDDYFGLYISLPFLNGAEDAPYLRFEINNNSQKDLSFKFANAYLWGPAHYEIFDFDVPYPRGTSESKHIEYTSEEGGIAFDVLGQTEDGRQLIEITEFPYSEYIGLYAEASDLDSEIGKYGVRLNWEGTYTCNNGGNDGTKSISVTQVDDTLLSIKMIHNYADGRVDTFETNAEIGFYSDDTFSAYSDQNGKYLSFILGMDTENGEKTITISQGGIYPAIDLEYDGIYVKRQDNALDKIWENFDTQRKDEISPDVPQDDIIENEAIEILPDLNWDGTYFCNNGGEDGTKILTIEKIDDTSLSVSMEHTYGDGHTDSFSGIASIGTYGNGAYFASYEEGKTLYFTLARDENSGEATVEVSQIGIYPAIDLEYDGIYTKQ